MFAKRSIRMMASALLLSVLASAVVAQGRNNAPPPNPPGTTTRPSSFGGKTSTWPDGTVVGYFPNGDVVVMHPDGSRETYLKESDSVVKTKPWGVTVFVKKDGSTSRLEVPEIRERWEAEQAAKAAAEAAREAAEAGRRAAEAAAEMWRTQLERHMQGGCGTAAVNPPRRDSGLEILIGGTFGTQRAPRRVERCPETGRPLYRRPVERPRVERRPVERPRVERRPTERPRIERRPSRPPVDRRSRQRFDPRQRFLRGLMPRNR